jgi:hypothetical protein
MARKFPNRRPSASTWRRESRFDAAEKRTAEDRRDCYWLYVVTRCKRVDGPRLMTIKDPAQLEWDEIQKIDHYALKLQSLQTESDRR